jgi:hypothetical protein
MNPHRNDPLKFINTFLRRDGEKRLSEKQFKEIADRSKDVYNLKWQVAVRRKFFGDKQVKK